MDKNNVMRGTLSEKTMSMSGTLAQVGLRGYSAYEIAVQNGFDGTEEEWLESLQGQPGERGDSGYEDAETLADMTLEEPTMSVNIKFEAPIKNVFWRCYIPAVEIVGNLDIYPTSGTLRIGYKNSASSTTRNSELSGMYINMNGMGIRLNSANDNVNNSTSMYGFTSGFCVRHRNINDLNFKLTGSGFPAGTVIQVYGVRA